MLEDIKNSLRISGNDLDTEISDLIDSAKADLKLSGIQSYSVIESDPLIKRAITLYCKANFGYEDPRLAERFDDSYRSLKQHLALSAEYTEEIP